MTNRRITQAAIELAKAYADQERRPYYVILRASGVSVSPFKPVIWPHIVVHPLGCIGYETAA